MPGFDFISGTVNIAKRSRFDFAKAVYDPAAKREFHPDAVAFFARVLSVTGQVVVDKRAWSNYISGLHRLGLWGLVNESWSGIASQNAGTGSKVIGIKGNDLDLVNGPTWDSNDKGIKLNGVNQMAQTVSNIGLPVDKVTVYDVVCYDAFGAASGDYSASYSLQGTFYSSQGFESFLTGTPGNRTSNHWYYHSAGISLSPSFPVSETSFLGAFQRVGCSVSSTLRAQINNGASSQLVGAPLTLNAGKFWWGFAPAGRNLNGKKAFSIAFNDALTATQLEAIDSLYVATLGANL